MQSGDYGLYCLRIFCLAIALVIGLLFLRTILTEERKRMEAEKRRAAEEAARKAREEAERRQRLADGGHVGRWLLGLLK